MTSPELHAECNLVPDKRENGRLILEAEESFSVL
jgi:hypothetical protein